jgi:hypothetical protein
MPYVCKCNVFDTCVVSQFIIFSLLLYILESRKKVNYYLAQVQEFDSLYNVPHCKRNFGCIKAECHIVKVQDWLVPAQLVEYSREELQHLIIRHDYIEGFNESFPLLIIFL